MPRALKSKLKFFCALPVRLRVRLQNLLRYTFALRSTILSTQVPLEFCEDWLETPITRHTNFVSQFGGTFIGLGASV